MSGVDRTLLFDDDFSSTDPVDTEFVNLSEQRAGVAVFVAPVGIDLSVVLQTQDPLGNWHSFETAVAVTDGTCEAITIGLNPGMLRAQITPSVGSGSARLWAVAFGGG